MLTGKAYTPKFKAVSLLMEGSSEKTQMYALGLKQANLLISFKSLVSMKIKSTISSNEREIAPSAYLSERYFFLYSKILL